MDLSLIRHVRRAIGSIGVALFVVLALLWSATHLAPLTGRELFIIVGGSMEPAIPVGSLVFTTPTDPLTITVGDVVTIRADNGVVVTHRVSRVLDGADGRSFELTGDANDGPDGGLVPARAIVGTADHYLPYGGYARAFLSTFPGLVSVLAFLGALILGYALLGMMGRPDRSIAPRTKTHEPTGP